MSRPHVLASSGAPGAVAGAAEDASVVFRVIVEEPGFDAERFGLEPEVGQDLAANCRRANTACSVSVIFEDLFVSQETEGVKLGKHYFSCRAADATQFLLEASCAAPFHEWLDTILLICPAVIPISSAIRF